MIFRLAGCPRHGGQVPAGRESSPPKRSFAKRRQRENGCAQPGRRPDAKFRNLFSPCPDDFDVRSGVATGDAIRDAISDAISDVKEG
jgi:hypothetical protein